ncbi:Acetylcholine receptor alpha subunit [Dirofilaria immitis]|nr:Acetylcholine receptor alpha subunit [Dirofilaria immitis]
MLLLLPLLTPFISVLYGNEDAKRLYDDLMVNYNKHRRPAPEPNKPITIKLKLRLSQIIDVHEIDQVMTCSVWLKQVWIDKKLSWNPQIYGGVNVLYVPYEMIWVPDIVLYNNADSYYNITISTKATLRYDGQVTWEPPAILKHYVKLTFDDGEARYELEMNENGELDNITIVEDGIDLSDYYPSVEWDIMSRVAKRHTKSYPTCCSHGAYIDIMFYLELRRKPLFYTVNLVFPCVGISFLTIVAFYLPSRSGEKITLCILTLVALTVFYLLLKDIIPATSIALPLIGKYLLFTMIMVSLSVFVTVISLNLHFRRPSTHQMPIWIKWLFLRILPKILFMRRPMLIEIDEAFRKAGNRRGELRNNIIINRHEQKVSCNACHNANVKVNEQIQKLYHSPHVIKAFENVCFIAELLKKKDRDEMVDEDWKFVAKVLDRLFLILFQSHVFRVLLLFFFSNNNNNDDKMTFYVNNDSSSSNNNNNNNNNSKQTLRQQNDTFHSNNNNNDSNYYSNDNGKDNNNDKNN